MHKHPELPFFAFDIYSVLGRAKSRLPLISVRHVAVWILKQPTLACIETRNKPCICLHPILSHCQPPEMVMDFILTHELLQLLFPPKEVNGIMKSHSPEFRAAELQVFPELALAWEWLTLAIGRCLKPDEEKKAIFVKRSWRRLVRTEYHRETEPDVVAREAYLKKSKPNRWFQESVGVALKGRKWQEEGVII